MSGSNNIKSDSLKVTNQLTSTGNFDNTDGFIFLGNNYDNNKNITEKDGASSIVRGSLED